MLTDASWVFDAQMASAFETQNLASLDTRPVDSVMFRRSTV